MLRQWKPLGHPTAVPVVTIHLLRLTPLTQGLIIVPLRSMEEVLTVVAAAAAGN